MAREADTASISGTSFMDYVAVVRDNRRFRILWVGELINQAGNWFSYVAALTKVERMSGNTGILISLVLISHYLPYLVFFPFAGVVADRFPREKTMRHACICAAIIAALIPLVQRARDLWLLYVLLFAQYSCASFYDPARRALEPTLVPQHQLGLAATLDTYAWSLMSALGGSLGGYAVSGMGTTGCFLLDCLTYVAAAVCAQMLVLLREAKGQDSGTVIGIPVDTSQARQQKNLKKTLSGPDMERGTGVTKSPSEVSRAGAAAHRQASTEEAGLVTVGEGEEETDSLLPARGSGPHEAPGLPVLEGQGEASSLWRTACRCLSRESAALREGCSYILDPSNRDVAVLVMIKAGGSLIWGASDLFNVHFASMPQMETLGDQPTTLGFIFCFVGIGCFLGPIIFDKFTPQRRLPLLVSTALGFILMFLSYFIMAIAPNVWMVLFSTAFRASGSAVSWVYSTVLLQLRVPNSLLGRILALELALLTVCECISGIFGGAVFDTLHWSIQEAVLAMAGIGAVVSLVFALYVVRVAKSGDSHPGYAGQRESETDSENELELLEQASDRAALLSRIPIANEP